MIRKEFFKKNKKKISIITVGALVLSAAIITPAVLVPRFTNQGSTNGNSNIGSSDVGLVVEKTYPPVNVDGSFQIEGNRLNFVSNENEKTKITLERIYTYSVHDGDTFRGTRTEPAGKGKASIRIVGFDSPELNNQTTGDKPEFGKGTKKWQEYFGDKSTLAVREILLSPDYNIFTWTTGQTTHNRPLASVYYSKKTDTNTIPLSLAIYIVKKGLAIPGRPNSSGREDQKHYDLGLPGANRAPIEQEFEDKISQAFIDAYKNKRGFFDTKEWQDGNENIAKGWTGISEWVKNLEKYVYPGINWWKSAERNTKYCTLDTLADSNVCKMNN